MIIPTLGAFEFFLTLFLNLPVVFQSLFSFSVLLFGGGIILRLIISK